jgi:hypothetical protein
MGTDVTTPAILNLGIPMIVNGLRFNPESSGPRDLVRLPQTGGPIPRICIPQKPWSS